jgi:hypothetical protein
MTEIISKDNVTIQYLADKTPIKTGKIKVTTNYRYSVSELEGLNRRVLIGCYVLVKHDENKEFKWLLIEQEYTIKNLINNNAGYKTLEQAVYLNYDELLKYMKKNLPLEYTEDFSQLDESILNSDITYVLSNLP